MITSPPLENVSSGDPITSESWNNVLTAIRTVYAELNKVSPGTLAINVINQADGNPVPSAVVTVIHANDSAQPVRSGMYAGADVKRYFVHELPAGSYNVVVDAEGYTTGNRTITMNQDGSSQSVSVDMTRIEPLFAMPNIFGMSLNKAVEFVRQAGFLVGRILDSHGNDVVPDALDDASLASVLGQAPEAGTMIPKNTPIQIHISAKAEFVERVRVPDLNGLTVDEAKVLLKGNQLVLGESSSVGK